MAQSSSTTNEPDTTPYTDTVGFSGCAEGSEAVPALNIDFEDEVLRLCNEERQKAGLPLLMPIEPPTRVPRYHSFDMAMDNYFEHNSHDRDSQGLLVVSCTTFERVRAFHQSSGPSENIAAGSPLPAQTVANWMNSTGHRANILNAKFKYIGIGYNYNAKAYWKHYWTKVFAE